MLVRSQFNGLNKLYNQIYKTVYLIKSDEKIPFAEKETRIKEIKDKFFKIYKDMIDKGIKTCDLCISAGMNNIFDYEKNNQIAKYRKVKEILQDIAAKDHQVYYLLEFADLKQNINDFKKNEDITELFDAAAENQK